MKRYICLIATILIVCFLVTACSEDSPAVNPGTKEISLRIRMYVPGVGQLVTRAVSESQVTSVTVLVFEDTGAGYQYAYLVPGYSLTASPESGYDFYARLLPTANPVRLYLVANAPTAVNGLTAGSSEATVRQAVTGAFTAAGFDATGILPMSGEIDLPDGMTDDMDLPAVLVRSAARADIVVSEEVTNFELTYVRLYRASNQYQVIPNELVGDVVFTASIPQGTTQSVTTNPIPVTATSSIGQVYLPESPLPAVADRASATVVVIGGIFNNSGEETFYRMDFVPDNAPELFGQVLRNHLYQFNINGVTAPGWPDPDEAAEYESSQIEVQVKVWEQNTVSMVFDDVNYFGVSARIIRLNATAGTQTIQVDTSLDTYLLYWTDENGVIDESIPAIAPGGSFTDADSLFTVAISADGTLIRVSSLETNRTGSPVTRYLLAEAGRLRLSLTIIQNILQFQASEPLRIYGSNQEIGRLGNQVFASTALPDRAVGLVALFNNTANFSPSGRVPVSEVIRGGVDEAQMPNLYRLELFDVLYLTYGINLNANSITNVLTWLNGNQNRVLVVQYDNVTTNQTLMRDTFGLVVNTINQTTPFRLYSDPPQIIMDNVFGEVPADMTYRCFDDIHGQITIAQALDFGISPILVNDNGAMTLGIDFNRRIVFSGDIDLYNSTPNTRSGSYLSADGSVGTNSAAILMGNLWAWIASVVFEYEQE